MNKARLKAIMSQQGFSLIELMIVVAIIGILSAIAIPNFQRYQEKSRQTEAQNELAGYFSAQKASYAEFSRYPGNFVAIGFKPNGQLNYRITAQDNGTAGWTPAPNPNDPACTSTADTCAAGGPTFGNGLSWTETDMASAAAASGCAPAITNTTFTACAAGDITGAALAGTANYDTWQITDNDTLTNTYNEVAH